MNHNKKQLILVVEGDKTSAMMTFLSLRGFLGCHPFRIELAETADEVYQVIQNDLDLQGQLPALIFLDPLVGKGKRDLFFELQERFPSVPKVLYSGKNLVSPYLQYLHNGKALCFLPRPWDGMYQADLLRTTLGMKRGAIS